MLPLIMLLQAAAPPAGEPQSPPDIAIAVDASIRRVTVERRGEASLEVHAGPDGGSVVDIQAPEANGQRTMRNVNVRVRGEARIADPHAPAQIRSEAETASPQ